MVPFSCGLGSIAWRRMHKARLAERHRALNVRPRHYELWLDALCEALAQHDPAFSVELEQMWRHAMQKGIKLMSEPAT
jgi:hemoglobin-like flavoprotein